MHASGSHQRTFCNGYYPLISGAPLPLDSNPLAAPRTLWAYWNKEMHDNFDSSRLEAWPHLLHTEEKSLRCSHSAVLCAILGICAVKF